jgi:hypothetical protein
MVVARTALKGGVEDSKHSVSCLSSGGVCTTQKYRTVSTLTRTSRTVSAPTRAAQVVLGGASLQTAATRSVCGGGGGGMLTFQQGSGLPRSGETLRLQGHPAGSPQSRGRGRGARAPAIIRPRERQRPKGSGHKRGVPTMGHTHRVGWDGGGGAWVREWSGDRQTPLQDHQVQKSLSGHPKHVLLRGLTAAGPGWWRVAAA